MSKKTPPTDTALKEVRATRRENLRRLSEQYDGNQALAKALKISDSYLSQMIGKNPRKPITEASARAFEFRLQLNPGALDKIKR